MRQLPIITRFRLKHKFSVLGISIDGNHFEGLDENITDPSVTNDPNIQSLPTILLLDKHNPAKIFLSHGLTTLDELEGRIVNRIKEQDEQEEKDEKAN